MSNPAVFLPDPERFAPPDLEPVDHLISGYEGAMVLQAAMTCGLFHRLAGHRLSASQLSSDLDWDHNKTEAFLDALAAMKLLEKEGRRYRLSALAECYLNKKSPYCIEELLELRFLRIAKLAAIPEKMSRGEEEDDPVEPRRFFRVMAQSALSSGSVAGLTRLIARDPVFRRAKTFLDLGCSHGLYSAALCRINPELMVTVFDRPEVLPHTRNNLSRYNIGERVVFQEGDFYRQPLGGGYNIVLASHVFYRPLKQVRPVFANLRRALSSGGVLYLQHHYLDASRTAPPQSALFHFTRTIAVPSFYVPTLPETAELLQQAGFTLTAAFRSRRRGSTVLRAER